MTICKTIPELYQKYHDFLLDRNKKTFSSLISCGDGWAPILDYVCQTIINHELNIEDQNEWAKKKNQPINKYPPVKFLQVKSKFDSLRIYYSGGDEYVGGVVAMAETISANTCQGCGITKTERESVSGLCKTCVENR
jgi:hypothetical protein